MKVRKCETKYKNQCILLGRVKAMKFRRVTVGTRDKCKRSGVQLAIVFSLDLRIEIVTHYATC